MSDLQCLHPGLPGAHSSTHSVTYSPCSVLCSLTPSPISLPADKFLTSQPTSLVWLCSTKDDPGQPGTSYISKANIQIVHLHEPPECRFFTPNPSTTCSFGPHWCLPHLLTHPSLLPCLAQEPLFLCVGCECETIFLCPLLGLKGLSHPMSNMYSHSSCRCLREELRVDDMGQMITQVSHSPQKQGNK